MRLAERVRTRAISRAIHNRRLDRIFVRFKRFCLISQDEQNEFLALHSIGH
jgi:hypothetical protein